MPVITISNQYGAGIEDVSEVLAALTGFRVIGKETIVKNLRNVVGEYLSEKFIAEQKPTFLDTYMYDMELWKGLISESLLFLSKEGKVILLGRGGSAILENVSGILHVLLVGNKAKRVELIAERENISPLEAESKIDKIDKLKAGFWKYHFGIDWPNPENFDIVLNPISLGFEYSGNVLGSLTKTLDLVSAFKKKGRGVIEKRYVQVSAINRVILSAGIGNILFDLSVSGDKRIKIRFGDVPAELRKKAIAAVAGFHKDYTVN
ncbi:MAG: cytidylate kinase-like family protein [Deltaproteobacteria bacterium]|nr:cytidylate kinase-like family protein [Deltaproteobacteria bacterium]